MGMQDAKPLLPAGRLVRVNEHVCRHTHRHAHRHVYPVASKTTGACVSACVQACVCRHVCRHVYGHAHPGCIPENRCAFAIMCLGMCGYTCENIRVKTSVHAPLLHLGQRLCVCVCVHEGVRVHAPVFLCYTCIDMNICAQNVSMYIQTSVWTCAKPCM